MPFFDSKVTLHYQHSLRDVVTEKRASITIELIFTLRANVTSNVFNESEGKREKAY